MSSSAEMLYGYFKGTCSFTNKINVDLFGYFNWTENMKINNNETNTMFLGLYKGLYNLDVTFKELNKCYMQNKLDELIHTKYSIRKNDYYKEFVEKNIKIGNTSLIAEEDMETDTNEDFDVDDLNGDFIMPFIYSTISPPYHSICTKNPQLIANISFEPLDVIIQTKINAYKKNDIQKQRPITEEYVNVEDVNELLFKQNEKCYICGDNVITQEWQSNCLYQFTLDRIDNTKPHNRSNVLISCFYCNCYGFNNDNTDICKYKLCSKKCHTIKRNITRNKNNISPKEIICLTLK